MPTLYRNWVKLSAQEQASQEAEFRDTWSYASGISTSQWQQKTQRLDTPKPIQRQPTQQKQVVSTPKRTSTTSSSRRTIELNKKNKEALERAVAKYGKEATQQRLKDAGVTYKNWQLTAPSQNRTSQTNQKNQMQQKIIDDAGKQNLDKQLQDAWYDQKWIQDYYKKNNIQYNQGQQPQLMNVPDSWYKKVTSLQDWMNRWKQPTELVDYVESKYGVKAEYDSKTNSIFWYDDAGNKTKQWTFDEGWNPVRNDIDVYTNDNFMWDYQNMISSGASKDEIHGFLKKNIEMAQENKDEVRSLYKGWLKQDKINQTAGKLSSLGWKWLFDAYTSGQFVEGDDVWNALTPEAQAQFKSFWSQNVKTLAGKTDDKWNLVPIVANLESTDEEEIYNALAQHNPEYQKNFREIVLENPERQSLQGDLNTKYGELEKKRMELNQLRDKIKKQYPSASPSFIQAKINKERGALLDEIDDLTVGYNTSLQEYNMIDADVQAEYGAYRDDAEIELQTYQQAVGIKLKRIEQNTAFANQKEIIELQAEQSRISQQQNQAYQWKVMQFEAGREDQAIARAEKNAGQYMTNEKWEVVFVQNGNYTKVLDSLGKVLATERYENFQDSVTENDYGGYTAVRTYNDWTAPTISSYNSQGQLVWGVPAIVGDALRSIPETWKQCWEAVNDYLQKLGLDRKMWDTYASKTEDINSDKPAIWGVAIWNPNRWEGKYKEYGHTGIITGISADWETLEITHWNYRGDEKKTVDQIPRSVIEYNGGYHIPQVAPDVASSNTPWTDAGATVYKDTKGNVVWDSHDAKAWAESIYQWDAKMSDVPTWLETAVNNEYRTYQNKDLIEFQETIDLINKIKNHPWRPWWTGNVVWLWNGFTGLLPTRVGSWTLPASDVRDFRALTTQLENKLFLTNIKGMKGMWSLSDAEGKKVSWAQGTLSDYGQSEDAYMDMLNRMLWKTQQLYDQAGWGKDPMGLNEDNYWAWDNPLNLDL